MIDSLAYKTRRIFMLIKDNLHNSYLSRKLKRVEYLNHEMQYDLALLRHYVSDEKAKALLQSAIDKSFKITKEIE